MSDHSVRFAELADGTRFRMTDSLGRPAVAREKHGNRGYCAECGEDRLIHADAQVILVPPTDPVWVASRQRWESADGLTYWEGPAPAAREIARLKAMLEMQDGYNTETLANLQRLIAELQRKVARLEWEKRQLVQEVSA